MAKLEHGSEQWVIEDLKLRVRRLEQFLEKHHKEDWFSHIRFTD